MPNKIALQRLIFLYITIHSKDNWTHLFHIIDAIRTADNSNV